MPRFTTSLVALAPVVALALAPMSASAAGFCVAVNGGFGNGGTSFVGPNFVLPAKNKCAPWAGFTKTGSTVVAFASGTGCLSNGGKVLTLSVTNSDPSFFGPGTAAFDQITLCPTGVTGCPVGGGQDSGFFGGSAKEQTCTTGLLRLPDLHD